MEARRVSLAATGDYGSRKAIDAPTKKRGANDIEMDASYVLAISVLPYGFLGTLLDLLS